MQATLGHNNACHRRMPLPVTSLQLSCGNPETLEPGAHMPPIIPTLELGPRMQATLGEHDACLHCPPGSCPSQLNLTFSGRLFFMGLMYARHQIAINLALVCCVCMCCHSSWRCYWKQADWTGLMSPNIPDDLVSKQIISRAKLLSSQGGWVAQDEIKFYLKQLGLKLGIRCETPCLPSIDSPASEQVQQIAQWYRRMIAHHAEHRWVATAVLLQHHWIPVLLCLESSTIYTSPAGRRFLSQAVEMGGLQFADLPMPVHEEEDMCGFSAIFAMQMHFGLSPQLCSQQFRQTSGQWRQWFEHHLQRSGGAHRKVMPTSIHFGGAGSGDVHAEVVELLQTKGVPAAEADDRAKSVLLKLGRQPLAKALRGQNPWREVKQLANLASPKVQLVLPSEARSSRPRAYRNRSPLW